MGMVQLVGGAALTAVAIADQGAVAAVVAVAFGASVYGGLMYAWLYRPAVRRGVEDPALAPTDDREPGWATTRRILAITGPMLVIFLLVAVASGTPGIVAGIAVGNGAAVWWTSCWLRRWELQAGRRLLREPRWRGRRQETGGWGRGVFDPQDFYVAPVS